MARNYSRKSNPVLADQSLIWDSENSDYRLTTFSDISTLFNANSTAVVEPDTQYASPAATAFNVVISANDNDTHLILTPAATYATGTITLPAIGKLRDKQLLIVNCTQQVTALTVDGNDATAVNGAPTSMGADDFFTLKYDLAFTSWNRIG